MELSDKIDSLLERIEKPSRYIGGEFGAVMKKPEDVRIRFAFLFPDTYEIGMSHLGLKILYHALNNRPDTWCERVFSPWVDMRDMMIAENVPLFSLESQTPINEFDILGITLQYEMTYSNVLTALSLAGIPLKSAERNAGPFVIFGGPCAFNPEPLAAFADIFVIGDGEEAIHGIIDTYIKWKSGGCSRIEFLRAAADIEGVYVPSVYDETYPRKSIRKALVRDLDAAEYPREMIVPYADVVHNRVMLELFRGCTRGCRFCQAGMIYRPVRERSMEKLIELAESLVDSTGYDEISLMSLSSGDYSCLPELARELAARFAQRRVSLSLPSLRADSALKDTLIETRKVKKTALTLAPEAGTQRLRDVINKNVTDEDLVDSVREAFGEGFSAVKLYFMIGLPTETDEDILGIAELVQRVRGAYFAVPRERRASGLRISVSASVFVPKPFTPFQWAAQVTRAEAARRQQLLRSALGRIKGVDFKYHDPDVSYIEAAFALGGREMAAALEAAYNLGCGFEGWSDQFKIDIWIKAFEESGIDPETYVCRERSVSEALPWDHIDAGVTKEFLSGEWEKARNGELTRDCRGGCLDCGVKRFQGACV